MSDMSEFFTAEAASEGVVLPLFRTDGTKSDHWIRIRGVDSQEFRIAETQAKQDARRIFRENMTDDQKILAAMDARAALAARLVIEWSFNEPCTLDKVVEFFKKAPQILDAIDKVAGDRTLFFALKQTASTDGLSQKSNSAKPRKAAKRH